LAEQGAFNL